MEHLMEKNNKQILLILIPACVLILGLLLFTIFMTVYSRREKDGPEQTSDLKTEQHTRTEPPATTVPDEPASITEGESTGAPQTTDTNAGVQFQEVNEQVTAKNEVNLRSNMDQSGEGNVVYCLVNGEVAQRTGMGNNGWSRVVYNGQTLYCVSSYLTTDLSYVPPASETGLFKTKFAPVSEKVTAKEATNLRDRPSVLEPSQVMVQLQHGQVAVRTGIANEGWSRVEYNGQVLYCISSYLELVEE